MNYLLDTHVLIWAITEKNRLSSLAIQAIENTENSIFISAISFWEISLKFSIGKLDLEGVSPDEFPKLSTQTGFKLISLSSEEGATYHNLIATNHRDPFDRMLIWQAIQQNLVFITKDKNVSQYELEGLKTLW